METTNRQEFFKEMNLTKSEINTFEKYVTLIESAQKNGVEFLNSEVLAFTPAALLVVAVAKFAYDVYQDYGVIARDPKDFAVHFKNIIKELSKLEDLDDDAPSLDTYARLRQDLLIAKKQTKK
jgi:hypothetical protein